MTPEPLKGKVRVFAKRNNIRAQEVLQMYMFEKFINRLSVSPYKDHFILKGGLLIASMLGITQRTTMDMDTTLKNFPMNRKSIENIMCDLCNQCIDDGVSFTYIDSKPIREKDTYENYRVSLLAEFDKLKIPMKIDITVGDIITPKEVVYAYPMLFEQETISILAYTIETILAEKYETIISRNITNTRARDFYDCYMLYHLYQDQKDLSVLRNAIISTSTQRGSLDALYKAQNNINLLRDSIHMQDLWNRYKKQNIYAKEILYLDIIDTLEKLTMQLALQEKVFA